MKWHILWPGKRVYADAAAAMPLSRTAQKELARLLRLFGNPSALHKEAVAAKKELEAARAKVARAIGAHADEIVFVGSGTEANNLALQGVLRPLILERGEVGAVTSAIEHSSVIEPLRALEREGLYVTKLTVDANGLLDPTQLREAVGEDTALVSVQMVNSEMGAVQNIRAIAKELRHMRKSRDREQGEPLLRSSKGSPCLPLYLHTDASQAPLWMSINVEKLGVDLMTLDAQKVGGPKGIGVLYVRRGTLAEPIIWGGGQEGGLRSGTENVAAAGAFAAALVEAAEGCKARSARIATVRDFLWSEIHKRIPDAILNGPACGSNPAGRRKGGRTWPSGPERTLFPVCRIANNINFIIPGLSGEMAVIALDARGISASTRSACDTEAGHPSHVLEALGVSPEFALSSLRLTLLPTATRTDARHIARALESIVALYRHVL